jgi:hypothetical protein
VRDPAGIVVRVDVQPLLAFVVATGLLSLAPGHAPIR